MSYNAGPRAAPLVEQDRVYTFGAEGDLRCLRTTDGNLLWQKQLNQRTPMWGFSASPLIEGDNVIIVDNDPAGTVVAFDKLTGQLHWQAVPAKEPGYASPIVIDEHAAARCPAHRLEPRVAQFARSQKTGKTYWHAETFHRKHGNGHRYAPACGRSASSSSFYNGSMMMKLDPQKPAAAQLWKIGGKNEHKAALPESLHAVLCTPVIDDNSIYGVCSYGQLRCLKAQTGERIWETFAATSGDSRPKPAGPTRSSSQTPIATSSSTNRET